jgi:hypothetical protein
MIALAGWKALGALRGAGQREWRLFTRAEVSSVRCWERTVQQPVCWLCARCAAALALVVQMYVHCAAARALLDWL